MTKNILIVDDSAFDRNLLAKALARRGYTTLEASSGEQCLDLLSNTPIALILMDIMMPGTFGNQVLIKIRETHNAISLPIIMVTAKADASDVVACLQTGANDYISKPVNFDVAVSRIAMHLSLSEMSREMTRLKGLEMVTAMIATYNHEINNPLAIALGGLRLAKWSDEAHRARVEAAMWRVADIVKKIQSISEQEHVEYETYIETSKMIKIK